MFIYKLKSECNVMTLQDILRQSYIVSMIINSNLKGHHQRTRIYIQFKLPIQNIKPLGIRDGEKSANGRA